MSFRNKINSSIQEAKKVLGTARSPCIPTDQSHVYDDKYLLAEIGTRTTLLAIRNTLDQATNNTFTMNLDKMVAWARAGKTVTLCTEAEELCSFVNTTEREVKSTTSRVTEKTGVFGNKSKREEYTITKVTEHTWEYQINWETYVYPADELEQSKIVLQSSTHATTLTTRGDTPVAPKPSKKNALKASVELSWLLKALDTNSTTNPGETKNNQGGNANQVSFTIDRNDTKHCHTPRRNKQIDTAIKEMQRLRAWANSLSNYLTNIGTSVVESSIRKEIVNCCNQLFDPIPATFVLEEVSPVVEGESPAALLSPNDVELILKRQQDVYELQLMSMVNMMTPNTIGTTISGLSIQNSKDKPLTKSMHNKESVQSILGGRGLQQIFNSYVELVNYIETMLRDQLISAIGKVVQPSHFAEYMNYHHRNLFNKQYAPKGFCHAVRRPAHYPEGTLSLEQRDDKGDYHPVPCMVAHRRAPSTTTSTNEQKDEGGSKSDGVNGDRISTSEGSTSGEAEAPGMTFPLNAASDLTFYGDQYLHSFVVHQFSGAKPAPMRLAARARQFSSFILMVGKMAGPTSFAPKSAIVVQNKDDLLIPLLLETIPTPKEFKDAIESLSPEQQRFAKSFRSMQLNSTLFGIVVIQIKPQLERVLNVPHDSLTKEIKLTQQLMKLFIEYQIPPDLLSYSHTEDINADTPIAAVKDHVKEIMSMLQESKDEEILQQVDETVKSTLRRGGGAGFGFGGGGGGFGGHPPPAPMAMASRDFGAAREMSSAAAPRSRSAKKMAKSAAPMRAKIQRPSQGHPSKGKALSQPTSTQPRPQKSSSTTGSNEGSNEDWTNVPKRMDEDFEKLDTDSALRPTILNVSPTWDRTTQDGLLSKPVRNRSFGVDNQKKERTKAFDLLDALTRSGVMAIETGASLHVVLCATHCFDKTLMDTIIQDNMNPIEKVERSSLIMASTIHQLPASAMIQPARISDVKKYSPMLFDEGEGGGEIENE